jgi:hypothetical protein
MGARRAETAQLIARDKRVHANLGGDHRQRAAPLIK